MQHNYSNRMNKTEKDRQQKRHTAKTSVERQVLNLGDRTTETDRQPRRHIRSRDREKHE